MAVKAINNMADLNCLMSTLLVYRAYHCISKYDTSTPIMTQRAVAIKNAMKEVQRLGAERQVTHALNKKDQP